MFAVKLFAVWTFGFGLVTCLPATANSEEPNIAKLVETNRAVQVEAGQKLSGRDALAAAYQKYGWPLPTTVEHSFSETDVAATAVQSGPVTATDLPNDRAYYVNVTLGTNTLLLNMDTGSSDLWGFSTAMPVSQRGKHHLYNLEGHLDSGETWDIAYVEGSGASGIVYADKVVIGKVTATVQAVEAATSVSSSFVTGLQDGIVGLGFGIGNTCEPDYCNTFMQQVAPTLPLPIFTATLRHNAPGEYDFGFIDTSKFTTPLTYNSLTGFQGGSFWEFTVGGYSIGTQARVAHSIDTIADTGTSLLITDQVIVNAFYSGVTGAAYNTTQGGVIFPCSSTSKLRDLSLYINGTKHTMPGAYGVYAQIGDPGKHCYGGVQSNNGNGYTVMGDVFLKSQFVVFDVHTPRIGFAHQKGVVI